MPINAKPATIAAMDIPKKIVFLEVNLTVFLSLAVPYHFAF
jgi:hypothetical protein